MILIVFVVAIFIFIIAERILEENEKDVTTGNADFLCIIAVMTLVLFSMFCILSVC